MRRADSPREFTRNEEDTGLSGWIVKPIDCFYGVTGTCYSARYNFQFGGGETPASQNSELCECAGMEVVAKPEEYCSQKPNQLSAVKSLRCDIYAFCGRGSFSTIATRRLLCSCSIWYATARLVTVAVRRRPEVRRSADACGTVPANHRSRSSDDPSSRNSPPERSSARVCFPASRNSSGNS